VKELPVFLIDTATFLDPLLSTLMEDPVILPTSNVTVDRSTIITQLLSSSIDPFNRKPLTIDMVIPGNVLFLLFRVIIGFLTSYFFLFQHRH
jgi:hypothetical protein